MNALARFEGFMQELMDRRVVRLLGGSLQPAEVAQAMSRALDAGTAHGVAPNRFQILLQPEDYANLREADAGLEPKLAEYAVELARERGRNFAAPPTVQLVADATVERGQLAVDATITRSSTGADSPWTRPRAADAPLRFEIPTPDGCTLLLLDHFPFTIGRRRGSDLVLPDARVSRDHAIVEQAGPEYRLRDLGSRNGTLLNGQPIAEADLRDGDQLSVGVFEVTVRIAMAP
jgi:hypothetical protein